MANLASQLEKITMAHTFLNWVDCLLTTWLQWFKTVGSGVEWLELATVKKECHQLYEQYKGEEWVCLFDVHFAPVDPSLEFLMDDLTAGMTLFEDLRPNDQFFFQHPIGVLAVARGEEQSEGHKGKGKAQEEESEDIEEQIEETFTDKHLAILLHWQKALTVVNMGLEAGVVLKKAKEKVTVSLEKRQEYKHMQGVCNNCWADNDPEGCCKEGKGDVEMRETTPLAAVAEAEQEVSNMEVKGEEEFEAAPVTIEEDKEEDKGVKEVVGTWSDMPLCQVSDNELEWLVDFNERAAGMEQWFQRKLETGREELLAMQAWYTVAKQTLATLVGYQCDYQAFLAWQEENNVRKGDWEKEDLVEVPDNNANLDA
ncbi:hypothetical protein J132_10860 [Termitomyces sp. J132]|nr:hypothetical protein J132_10860 [Termitomyces sp. J132]